MTRRIITLTLCFILFLSADVYRCKPENISKYLISIVRYIEWPSQMNQGNFKIGVYGSFPMYKALCEEFMGVGLQNRNVDIINIVNLKNTNLTDLHILFIAGNKNTPEEVLRAQNLTPSKPTLIITESKESKKSSAGINFYMDNNKLNFDLNNNYATRNGIQINSQLRAFASNIY